ncbi:MSMEG_1061 family FMN-dependent PPOX-type flavoprotein [Bacterioplanoides sp.]|uniref:MSMEG_1061 family FMN-dependent PPOX-type flavoprotein n=1 Tax=Bacterioplanoides sp. TaxID=2066072 RepID=UPI003B5C808D
MDIDFNISEKDVVNSVEKLREIIDFPKPVFVDKEKEKLDLYTRQYIQLSPYMVMSSSDGKGMSDSSPRGGEPGFVSVVNDHTLAIPDRPGNNRVDTLENIIHYSSVGLLFLIPGFSECLRVNGDAVISTNQALIDSFEFDGKKPSVVILIDIKQVYFHCSKAIIRSRLWQPDSIVDRSIMPSLGEMLLNQDGPGVSQEEVESLEKLIESRIKTTLY